ncbi:MAG TPA: HD domain-containing protein [Candidatus Hydrothermia bacterium]|nr:HD domain-containing protein [Candidatus Hydrothermia bacterium]
MQQSNIYEILYRIGIALTSEGNIQKLLERIVDEAMQLAGCDGGTIYTLREGHLIFKISKNRVLQKENFSDDISEILKVKEVPLTKDSLSGYVALTKAILSFPDRKSAIERGFVFDSVALSGVDYTVESSLTMPLITSEGNVEGILQLVNAREGERIVPFKPETIEIMKFFTSQAAAAMQNARLIEQLKETQLDAIYMLSTVAEFRDKVTGDHIKRISKVSYIVARTIGMDREFSELILYASPMHDIGKIAIPDSILNKPSRLTPQEWEIMKKHTIYGASIIKESKYPLFQMAKNIALNHHERYDGNGYPNGVEGEQIPIEARIVQVADVFDALVSERPYKSAWNFGDAFDYLKKLKGEQFDPNAVDAFFDKQELIFKLYTKS